MTGIRRKDCSQKKRVATDDQLFDCHEHPLRRGAQRTGRILRLIELLRRVEGLRDVEAARIEQKAARYLKEVPVTVTAEQCERSEGGRHDYYSEGDYWWPDPTNPAGPYIRRDGETNPDLFYNHRHALVRLSEIIGTLASAFLLDPQPTILIHAIRHLRAWFVDPDTRMTPNLLYGQAIKGRNSGRSIGIITVLAFKVGVDSLPR